MESVNQLLGFIENSPTAYHAVEQIGNRLSGEGYRLLSESDDFLLTPGGKYYVIRGGSSLLAFRIPTERPTSFRIVASHSDSPMFKLKNRHELTLPGYLKLNVEPYGGMIYSSWFDRPLSVAGRVVARVDGKLTAKNVCLDRDVAIIPNVCIHFNRSVNSGYSYNPQVDLLPLIGSSNDAGRLDTLIAEQSEIEPSEVVSSDLFLYNRMKGSLLGLSNEYFAAPRIDNLECAFGTLEGFLTSISSDRSIPIYAIFDNEETGSTSRQGAASTFLSDLLTRISAAFSISPADELKMIASSFMVSADNAHAKHPNHPELSDSDNAPLMNGGIVIKYNANQKYTTDALSDAVFSEICSAANVPTQPFANRSNIPGGSTLGNISNTKVSLPTVDIGLAQLAMHSCYETAGTADLDYLITAISAFYSSSIRQTADGSFTVSTPAKVKECF